ncbi:L-glyceraldehyde reductase [Geosmithia morbida]|uniref:L-glyceraldehyde reductase n=1 Tax=Geosmithia morbida TaxID=1094350 RepID=A0A9P4YTT3_9HYPO|nr:L-glyceraldehyde reductase [Geosmithia morbida]KAF4122978.1 L-glyceraldehyde reductase [Geosmithia morbida]
MSLGKTATLNTGAKIPTLGYGTWQSAPGEVGAGVYEALKAGYRHLDLAKVYQNQKEVAQGIKQAISEIPGLKREDIFITSKLWNNSHHPSRVAAALDDTLAELELDYLDHFQLYLIHWPVTFVPSDDSLFPKKNDSEVEIDDSVTLTDTWKALIDLPKSKVKAIGVSNFDIEHLETIINDTGVVPAVNQIERHPRLPGTELLEYADKKGIHITGYSAFGNNTIGAPLLIASDELKAIADRLSKAQGQVTPAQVILAWSQIGGRSVIPKSVTPSRIRSNFLEIEIDDEAIKALDKLGENPHRFNVPVGYKPKWSINIWNTEAEKSAAHKVILRK